MDKEHTIRIFFALWPDDDVRQQIIEAFMHSPQYKKKGRVIRPENIHATLHFIGNVTEESKSCMHQAAQSIKSSPFSLTLDRYGHFYKARVLWMGCYQLPDEAKNLYRELGDALKQCEYQPESRPFVPHVTLMRKLVKPGEFADFEPIEWTCNDFVLVQSKTIPEGVQYEVIERYPLSS